MTQQYLGIKLTFPPRGCNAMVKGDELIIMKTKLIAPRRRVRIKARASKISCRYYIHW